MKILVVEDDPISCKILKRILENEGYKVITAKDGKEGLELFSRWKNEIGLLIVDWIMPKMDGLELCKKIRKENPFHYVYIIFLSSKIEKKDIVAGLNAGGDDYLTKPFDPEELLSRVKVGFRIINLERALKEANEKLKVLATIDELTGILNRRALFERLREEISRTLREKTCICFVMADIDHFKRINDEYGHILGDKVLFEVVKRLKEKLRPYDVIGRYGGEEFLIAISKVCGKDIKNIAERLRSSVSSKPFYIDGKELCITISLGVSCEKLSGKKEIEDVLNDLLKKSDNALYNAKNRGRNCVFYI